MSEKIKAFFSTLCKKHKRKLHIDSVRLGTSISQLPLFRVRGLSFSCSPCCTVCLTLTLTLAAHTSTRFIYRFFCQHICQFFFHSPLFFVGFSVRLLFFWSTTLLAHTRTVNLYTFAHRQPNLIAIHTHTYDVSRVFERGAAHTISDVRQKSARIFCNHRTINFYLCK